MAKIAPRLYIIQPIRSHIQLKLFDREITEICQKTLLAALVVFENQNKIQNENLTRGQFHQFKKNLKHDASNFILKKSILKTITTSLLFYFSTNERRY